MHKYETALFIGRFQPFHNGHLYSLKKCLEVADKVIVGIGSSQESGTESNPWSFEERVKMIGGLQGLSLQVEIVAIPDTPEDENWVENVSKIVSKENSVIVSNNEWVTRLMGGVGYQIYETGLYNRDELEGVKIRELMRKGDTGWKLRVPKTVVSNIYN